MTVKELLCVEDLRVTFGSAAHPVRAVDGVSFSMTAGQGAALVGESGCGKSATALALARLHPERSTRYGGRIRWRETDVLTMNRSALRQLRGGGIGYVFQEPAVALNPVLRVGEQVCEAVRAHGRRAGARSEAVALLRRVRLPDADAVLRAFPHELSGGQQQRIVLAMALAGRPRLLVADEPTTALDVTTQASILALLQELREKLGAAVMLITHDLALVSGMASILHVMYAGRLVESGPPEAVLDRPTHPYTAALLAAVPRLQYAADRLASVPGQVPQASAWPSGCRFHPRCPYADADCDSLDPGWQTAGARRYTACRRWPEWSNEHA